MELYEVIKARRSIRKFKDEEVLGETIMRILEAANLAPTAANRQPWSFLVVRRSSLDRMSGTLDQAFKERVGELGREVLEKALQALPVPVEASEGKVEGLNRFYKTLGGAPVAIVVHVPRETDPWMWKNNVIDASAAIENLILAAWNEGLGSCWMTGPLKKKEKEIKALLNIPEDQDIIGIIPLGIPVHIPDCPPKKDLGSKVRWFE
jgi:nitroreductase